MEPSVATLQQRWIDRYGPLVAAQLEPGRRYSLVRVGSVEYAFSSLEHYVRALRQVWDAGLVPEPLPNALGSSLLDVAPRLQGEDSDLADLRRSDTKRPSRFS